MAVGKKRTPPEAGTKYTRTYKGRTYTMTVVSTARGLGYRVGRKVFTTPTAAAKSITNTEINGWMFWGLDN